ncbi:MAG: DUF1571 domain-containing protein [Sphingobacteriaceae bacterium]|nr:DUF1571 domain-containing protein [Sphingobacteriaceae bacterium]
MKRVLGIFTLLVFNLLAFSQKEELSCKDIVLKAVKSIDEVKSLKYHLKITERGKKGFNYYESAVKFQKKPRKIYLYIKGIEVLWVEGKNKGKALVKPNSFPYFNLNLDPLGDLMRQDQHHSLNEMGYDYFGSIIAYSVQKIGSKFDEYFTLDGEEKVNGRMCYKVIINNKDFSYTDYKVGENESITSIARKLHICEYMIVERNKKFKDYFDILKPGEIIKVPTWYCKKVEMYIDKFYFLPISMKIEDDKGLFEEYNYMFLQVNPKIEDAEFTKDYKEYKF